MPGLTKHREARDTYQVDLRRTLGTEETLSDPSIQVERSLQGGRAWVDVTAEFIPGGQPATIAGTAVEFTLQEAAAGGQLAGTYRIEVKATTSLSRVVVGVAPLEVD